MSTSTIQNQHDSASRLPLPPEGAFTQPANTLSLTEVTAATRFSQLAPHLHKSMTCLSQPEAHLLDTLTGNIATLQESFVDSLYNMLCQANIDVSNKITVRLNSNGQLILANSHPHKEIIETLLTQYPEFSLAFHELAMQSQALRSICSLHSMLWRASQPEGIQADGKSNYQLSLKGDMSHFYFNG